MTQETTQKNKTKKNEAAAAKYESTLAEAEAQGTERKSMKSSSTEVNLRGVPAQPEHRRQDGWTSTPCGSVEVKQDSDLDTNAGERLPNNAHTVKIILNTFQKNSLLHKSRIRMKRQVLSCYIPAAT